MNFKPNFGKIVKKSAEKNFNKKNSKENFERDSKLKKNSKKYNVKYMCLLIIYSRKRETPKKEPRKEEFAARKLRRRSKSAQNLLNPYNNIKSKVATGLTQFRTPQPVSIFKSITPTLSEFER